MSSDVGFSRGVRKDGTPWITYRHPSFGPNVVKLAMPNDPDYEPLRSAADAFERGSQTAALPAPTQTK